MPCRRPSSASVAAWLDCSALAARASAEEIEARQALEQLRLPQWKRLLYPGAPPTVTVAWRGRRYRVEGVEHDRLILRRENDPPVVAPPLQELAGWRKEPAT